MERYGQEVVLRGRETAACRAIVQPCLDRSGEQEEAGPLGLERRERFRYMGPAGLPLDLDTVVEWRGRTWRVRSAQLRVSSVQLVGEGVCPHWWAMLVPREEGPA